MINKKATKKQTKVKRQVKKTTKKRVYKPFPKGKKPKRDTEKSLLNPTTLIFGLLVLGFVIALPFITEKPTIENDNTITQDMKTSIIIEEPDNKCEGRTVISSEVSDNKDNHDEHLRLAKENNDKNACEKIALHSTRDMCYMYFVNQKDYSVCELIANSYIRRSCESLKQIEMMSK